MNWHPHHRRKTAAMLSAIGFSTIGLSLSAVPIMPAQAAPPAPFQISRGFSWDDIFRILKPNRRSGGSRDGTLCILSINQRAGSSNYVMNLHPTLAWKGKASAIELYRFGEQRPFWQQSLSFSHEGIQRIRYNSVPLMPNGRYTWKIRGLRTTAADFQMLSAVDRGRLKAQLAAVPGKDEASVLQRADIYRNFQITPSAAAGVNFQPQPTNETVVISSDAVNEILSIRNRSAALEEQINAMPTSWCPQTSSTAS